MQHATRYIWFDLIRGMSAVAVCASHLRPAIMVDYAQISTSSIPIKLFYLLSGFGHQAVVVFFVLSGFFVGGSVLSKRIGFSWKNYGIARLTRLWVVLIPALLLTLGVNIILTHLAPEALDGAFRDIWNSGPSPDKPFSSGLVTFLGNVFFLQTIIVPVFGVNAPLWSLAYEFWYYMLFPLSLSAIGILESQKKSVRILSAIALCAGLTLLPAKITILFLVWLFGVGLWVFRNAKLPRFQNTAAVFTFVLFLGVLLSTKTRLFDSIPILSDITLGFAFSLFAFFLLPISTDFVGSIFMKWIAKWSSEISYSLYVIHFPLIMVVAVIFYKDAQLKPDAAGILQTSAWMAFLIASGWVSWLLFERQTPKVRKNVSTFLNQG